MSIDLNWETVTGGPDGQELAHKIRDFIHNKFQSVPLPRFIKSVTVHDFEFGSIPPEIELKDITDPLPDFYEEQPGIDSSEEEDSEEDIAYENDGEYLDDPTEQQQYGGGRLRGASTSESRRRLTVNSSTGSFRSGPNAGRVAYLPPHLNPHYNGSGNNSSQSLDRDGRYYRDNAPVGPAHGTNHHHADLGSPFLGVSTPGIPGGTSNLNLHYFTSQFTAGLSGTQTPLAAVAGAAHQRGPSWIADQQQQQQQNAAVLAGHAIGGVAGANQGLHSSSTPNLRLHHFPGTKTGGPGPSPLTGTSTPLGALGTAGGVGGIGRGMGMAGMGSIYPPTAPVLAIPSGPRHKRNPSSQSSNSVGDYSPIAPAERVQGFLGTTSVSSPPSKSPSPVGLGIGAGGRGVVAGGVGAVASAASLMSGVGPRLQIPKQGLREKHSVSTLAPNSAGGPNNNNNRTGSAILDDDDGFLDGRDPVQQLEPEEEDEEDDLEEEDDEERQRFREPRVEDIQAVFRIKYAGDVKLLLTADILLDYPMPSFVGIPVRLSITGLTFDGVGVVAYIRKRVHFCFLSPEDAVAAVGGEENKAAGTESRKGSGLDGAKTKMGGLLQEIRVESEIGQRESGKQSLKNVGKVERFVLEQVRRIFEEEFVYPSFWTFLV